MILHLFYPDGTHCELPHVEYVRLIGTVQEPPIYVLEVKTFGNGSVIHRGLKGWIWTGGTHELKK